MAKPPAGTENGPMMSATADASVTVVINCYNDLDFLPQAIESVLAQSLRPAAIIVVDDGSRDDPAPFIAPYPGIRLVRQANAGLASARNAGLAATATDFVLFLDADDRLLPPAIDAGLAAFERCPDAALVYGGHRRIDAAGRPIGDDRYDPVGPEPYLDLLRGNYIAMHATVLYRTQALRSAGGFDPTLRRCEDYDLYLRIARAHPIACHQAVISEYRWHGANMSHDIRAMLATVLSVHARHKGSRDAAVRRAWRDGQRIWRDYYAKELLLALRTEWQGRRNIVMLLALSRDFLMAAISWTLPSSIAALLGRARKALPGVWPPAVGRVNMGHLSTPRPVSLDFGFDRGLPVDRYYVEAFLARHSADIAGTVLEIGDDDYSRRFGGERVSRQEILHVHAGNPQATLVGELSDPQVVRDAMFDCMILTQTLHLIWDFQTTVRRIHAALKPGGTVLLTVPGISQIDRGEWGAGWYWSFTRASIQRLFSEIFGDEAVRVEQHGNVFAATAFLHGLALAEVDTAKLDVVDEAYPVIVAVRARKPL